MKGAGFVVLAYLMWGVFPVYWKLLAAVRPLHILSFRILCSLVLVGTVLAVRKNTAWLGVFKQAKTGLSLILAALTLSFNWGLYIWAVNGGHTIEASLGYYMNPLISIIFGLCVFKEKLKVLQWVAFAIAMLGVLILTVFSGALPWVPLGLALSFSLYGVFKKTISFPALESLGAETLAACPLAFALLFIRFDVPNGQMALFDTGGLSYLAVLPAHTWILLLLCGAVTTLPLYCFARGARLLSLSAIGFIQFISPTLQFIEGVFIFGESLPPQHYIAVACIWAAALLYIVSICLRPRKAYT